MQSKLVCSEFNMYLQLILHHLTVLTECCGEGKNVADIIERCSLISGKTKMVHFHVQVGAVSLTTVEKLYVTSMLARMSLSQIIGLDGVESANVI